MDKMANTERIYVAGKYTANTEGKKVVNVDLATDVAGALFLMGHFPYIPHSLHWVERRLQEVDLILGYEHWMAWGLNWLDACDSLFLIDNSPGANRELKRAQERGIKIYTRIVDVPNLTNCYEELGKHFSHLHCLFSSSHIDKELLK